ncbi:hypothetical protein DICVIV_13143 [Dictyocaulus viviparus]|uniref:Uncharacterized protein n=1 Tax=Dictyocaulus viviparus TaxID=29172 RepID=A0A0D8XEP0_DICVI|nr:hypothetical protein DICVIV_13143 [Dictyocaulus viviparus]
MMLFGSSGFAKSSPYSCRSLVVYNPHCHGFSSMTLSTSNLFANPTYDAVWKFWIRKIVTVFLPFTGMETSNFDLFDD